MPASTAKKPRPKASRPATAPADAAESPPELPLPARFANERELQDAAYQAVFPTVNLGKLDAARLNRAQLVLLPLLSGVQTEAELNELRRALAKLFIKQFDDANPNLAKELGVDTKKGAAAFLKKTHYRTPYK